MTDEIDPPGGPDDDEGVPLVTMGDVQRELGKVYRAMRKGRIPTERGNGLTQTLQYLGKVTEATQKAELEARLEKLERLLAAH